MLHKIDGVPPNVLGLAGVGVVEKKDYEEILEPMLEEYLRAYGKIRLLYVLGEDFKGFSAGAVWEDMLAGISYFRGFEKVAVVSDQEWIRRMDQLIDAFTPYPVRHFSISEIVEAKSWIAE